ncbi:MAG: transcriptional regulator [Microcystis panniformis Mp_MB_F_20051200_S9]|uniref:Transcriptional regulator n=1 Tax=Microcystis panniformis Mp_MB_F_20051200_S9 TaxID=2486223 RepID=A0A552Q5L7_9CHRO|nr:MAG: transcriptional regulator [Microcystis panniformis Mp_MB_F_20080800_S26D]TRV43902.1 MAG: transcriptional regulator [Microcystis panniformis Mp_GB_SS_20050300_S99]TRV48041.1 MAG: transcriptional regulator [Microcystis panniformis Mp_GB_SS_20050300_S99D]TRV62897.1 MAG: transcriptional regulator [Microcystis panniformis Mp_MB_F_20080800_S26]TRV64531.1 MAG: transcriptional regulator [Microcystis panniformis Mp_MB_F_20051200_S9]TRV65114.1 MAG: transcriptional regulator [Microcystis pannifor
MSQVISTRLPDRTAERLKQLARQLGKTPSETSAILIEESLRESEFPYIEFRQSPLGRQPYLKNSSLALWEVMQIAQSYALDEQKTAAHFHRPCEWVRSALLYAEAYQSEVEKAIAQAQILNETTLKRLLPQLETITVSPDSLWVSGK